MLKYILAALVVLPTIASARPNDSLKNFFKYDLEVVCGPTSDVLKEIDKYKEKMKWTIIEDNGTILSLWSNEETKSFTLIKTTKDAVASCIIGYNSGNRTS